MKYKENDLRKFGKLICDIANGAEMTREESKEAYRQVILNEQPELQQGAFLMAHIGRNPTKEELAGAWEAMDQFDTAKISFEGSEGVCDIVGTGSDNLKTLNCSTPAALIASACGLNIAKKGARLVTGVSGATDILENFGLNINSPLKNAERCLKEHGICYLPGEAFLKSGWARLIKSMRFTSAFNIIGPLTRPCEQNNTIVIGAYSPNVSDQLIVVLKEIGMESAFSPYGMVEGLSAENGMDEYSLCGPTRVTQLKNGEISTHEITPSDFGVKQVSFDKIASSNTAELNSSRIKSLLTGEYETADADFICINAAAALVVSGLENDYKKAFIVAKNALSSGKALEKLHKLIEFQGE